MAPLSCPSHVFINLGPTAFPSSVQQVNPNLDVETMGDQDRERPDLIELHRYLGPCRTI